MPPVKLPGIRSTCAASPWGCRPLRALDGLQRREADYRTGARGLLITRALNSEPSYGTEYLTEMLETPVRWPPSLGCVIAYLLLVCLRGEYEHLPDLASVRVEW